MEQTKETQADADEPEKTRIEEILEAAKLSLIHRVCAYGELDTLADLIELKGVDPCLVNEFLGLHPIHVAAIFGQAVIVKTLVEKYKAKFDCCDIDGLQPLHHAIQYGHLEIAEFLVMECKASIEQTTKRGLKPIHIACQYGQLKIVQLLIREGCSPTTIAENELQRQPIHYAAQDGHVTIVEELIDKHGVASDVIDAAGNAWMVSLLLKETKDLTDSVV